MPNEFLGWLLVKPTAINANNNPSIWQQCICLLKSLHILVPATVRVWTRYDIGRLLWICHVGWRLLEMMGGMSRQETSPPSLGWLNVTKYPTSLVGTTWLSKRIDFFGCLKRQMLFYVYSLFTTNPKFITGARKRPPLSTFHSLSSIVHL